MSTNREEGSVVLTILEDTLLSLLKTFAPKLYSYRINPKLVQKVAQGYVDGEVDNLLLLSSEDFDD